MTYVVPLSTVYLVGVVVMPFWGTVFDLNESYQLKEPSARLW